MAGGADGAPYAGLTPDCVLDALASAGLFGDGRLLALNSYENRVYQVWLDEVPEGAATQPAAVVAKFYRPARWTDAQILEEHSFASELAEREIPVVAPMTIAGGARLPHSAAFDFRSIPNTAVARRNSKID